ncbi:MAG: ATP-dependent Clp protease ATP-binding subunit, partial [Candidatus Tectomicrobia bacterium]|nr:ATP-dependent Clp protease ATP-binding subunit [Candidatus Tectomicrobia bacterium]
VRTLHQKTKNIPVLISEPGVSRVAVVKGLALRIAHGDVVASMRTKRIVELHMHDLARTLGSRRQFAQCVGQLLEEASRHPDIVLFFDEMHAVMGSGSGEGSIDVANLLKPALSKGNLRCIGATTLEDYRRFIAPDALLDRYCQAIVVNEPSSSEMQEILVQIRPQYEEHHMVRITPEALEAIVELASKHMPEKRFPEKAIDILDQACSRARISQVTQLEALMTAESLYEVTRETIAAVIAQKTGLPVAHVLEPPRERLQRLARELQAQVKGGGKL